MIKAKEGSAIPTGHTWERTMSWLSSITHRDKVKEKENINTQSEGHVWLWKRLKKTVCHNVGVNVQQPTTYEAASWSYDVIILRAIGAMFHNSQIEIICLFQSKPILHNVAWWHSKGTIWPNVDGYHPYVVLPRTIAPKLKAHDCIQCQICCRFKTSF